MPRAARWSDHLLSPLPPRDTRPLISTLPQAPSAVSCSMQPWPPTCPCQCPGQRTRGHRGRPPPPHPQPAPTWLPAPAWWRRRVREGLVGGGAGAGGEQSQSRGGRNRVGAGGLAQGGPARHRQEPPQAWGDQPATGRMSSRRADFGLGSLRGTLLRTSFALPGSGSNQQAESRLRIQGKGRAGARYGHGSDPPSPSLTRRRAALSTWNAACPADLRREGPLPCREVRGTRGRHGSRVGLPALSKAHPSPLRPQGRHLLPSRPQFKGK